MVRAGLRRGATLALVLLGSSIAPLGPSAQAAVLCQDLQVTLAATADGQDVHGTEAADVISTDGHDRVTIHGNGGDDVVCATTGRSAVIHDGPGAERYVGNRSTLLSYSHVTRGVRIDLGSGSVTDGSEIDTVSGVRKVWGSPQQDVFIGTDGADAYRSRGALLVPAPDDRDLVHTGAGDDRVTADIAEVALGPGDDTATVAGGSVHGGAGDDQVSLHQYDKARSGTMAAYGGPGRDHLFGSVLVNDARTPVAEMVLVGGAGRDVLSQVDVHGSTAFRCPAVCAHARLSGGRGRDRLSLESSRGGLVDLAAGTSRTRTGRALITSIEGVIGSSERDVIRGDARRNHLTGEEGDDLLIGRGGRDRVDGGGGIDRCVAELRRGCEHRRGSGP